jgi:hypothetical protein
VEVIQQEEWVEVFGVAEAECAAQMHAWHPRGLAWIE